MKPRSPRCGRPGRTAMTRWASRFRRRCQQAGRFQPRRLSRGSRRGERPRFKPAWLRSALPADRGARSWRALQRLQHGRCSRRYAAPESGACRPAPAAASGWRAFSSMPDMDDMAWRRHANGVKPIGARSSIITIFPASGFMRYCKTMALSRSALPRLHGGDRDQGMRGGSLPVADQHLPESRETSSGEHAAARRPFSFFRFLGESHPAGCDPAHPASPCRFQTSMLFLTNRMLAVICV
jgi:hypothetical protein